MSTQTASSGDFLLLVLCASWSLLVSAGAAPRSPQNWFLSGTLAGLWVPFLESAEGSQWLMLCMYNPQRCQRKWGQTEAAYPASSLSRSKDLGPARGVVRPLSTPTAIKVLSPTAVLCSVAPYLPGKPGHVREVTGRWP